MPFLSDKRHRLPYTMKPDAVQRLQDVESLLRTITGMPLHTATKRRMLNHTVWLVVELTGNFHGRYRSAGVLEGVGIRIQRDHVFPRKVLVDELLQPNPNFASIVERAQCCVVTHDEHKELTRVPKSVMGWERYERAGVKWHDMLNAPSAETAPAEA